jgi:hypothetical protein
VEAERDTPRGKSALPENVIIFQKRVRWATLRSNTALDGPACKGLEDRFGDLVGCGHMSGPFERRIWPLALMEFADRVPIKIAR